MFWTPLLFDDRGFFLIALPVEVARLILFSTCHPVRAWRTYISLSIEKLAEMLDVSVEMIEKIESSNAHLEKTMLSRLSDVFKVDPSLIAIRYTHMMKTKKLSFYDSSYI